MNLLPDSLRSQNSLNISNYKQEQDKIPQNVDLRAGECVMRTLFHEFTVQAEKKMAEVMSEPVN